MQLKKEQKTSPAQADEHELYELSEGELQSIVGGLVAGAGTAPSGLSNPPLDHPSTPPKSPGIYLWYNNAWHTTPPK